MHCDFVGTAGSGAGHGDNVATADTSGIVDTADDAFWLSLPYW